MTALMLKFFVMRDEMKHKEHRRTNIEVNAPIAVVLKVRSVHWGSASAFMAVFALVLMQATLTQSRGSLRGAFNRCLYNVSAKCLFTAI